MDATEIGLWKVGYDNKRKKTVLMCEFSDREPLVLAMAPATGVEIGKALINIDAPGVPTPMRKS